MDEGRALEGPCLVARGIARVVVRGGGRAHHLKMGSGQQPSPIKLRQAAQRPRCKELFFRVVVKKMQGVSKSPACRCLFGAS